MSTKCKTKPTRRHRDSTRSKVEGTHTQKAHASTTQTLAGTGHGPRHTGIQACKQVFMGLRNSQQLSISTECNSPHTRRGRDSTHQQVQGTYAPMACARRGIRCRINQRSGFWVFFLSWVSKTRPITRLSG